MICPPWFAVQQQTQRWLHTGERCRGGYDRAKKRKGSKLQAAVDTLGHLLAVKVTGANEQ